MSTNPSDVSARPTAVEAISILRAYARKQHLPPNDNNFDDAANVIGRQLSMLDAQSKLLAEREWRHISIRPLEWVRDAIRQEWYGNTPPESGIHGYQVSGNKWWRRDGGSLRCLTDSEEAAKAACQADWDDRIRSALLPKPPVPTEGNDDV